jgi:hypothetical protein
MRRAADRQRPAQIICHIETAVVNIDDVAAVEQQDDIDAPQQLSHGRASTPAATVGANEDCTYADQNEIEETIRLRLREATGAPRQAAGSVAVIRVGDATEVEVKERKESR